jgi:hypothetical protein
MWAFSDTTNLNTSRSARIVSNSFDIFDRESTGGLTRFARGGTTLAQNLFTAFSSVSGGAFAYGNGVLVASNLTVLNPLLLNQYTIAAYDRSSGLSAFWNSKIQEIILYPVSQTSNQTVMENIINGYYDIY